MLYVCNGLTRPADEPVLPRSIGRTGHKGKKVEDKGLDTCYSAAYMSQTRDQQCFTISEVAADWYVPMSAAAHYVAIHYRAKGQLDPRCS